MRTVTATEAKNRLGVLLADVAGDDDGIVIESHGRPRAVIVSYGAFLEFLEARDRKRRQDAMEALRQLRTEVRARNLDLDEATADTLIEEVSAELRTRTSTWVHRQANERAD